MQPSWSSLPTTALAVTARGCAPVSLRGCLRCVRRRTETTSLHFGDALASRAGSTCAAPGAAPSATLRWPLLSSCCRTLLHTQGHKDHVVVMTLCTRRANTCNLHDARHASGTSRSPPPQGGVATTTMTTRPTRFPGLPPPHITQAGPSAMPAAPMAVAVVARRYPWCQQWQ